MKFLCIGLALAFTLILAAGCVAEVMGSATDTLSFMMLADRGLAAGCLISCCLAIYRFLPAAILIWILVVIHGFLCLRYDVPGQLLHGVLRFAVGAAVCLTIGLVAEKRRLLPP
jgi:hypothetical protein